MSKRIVVLGSDGYIGYALTLRLLSSGYSVVGIDDFRRRKAVFEMGSFSAVQIEDKYDRIGYLEETYDYKGHELSVESDYNRLYKIIADYSPDVIVNLAQQPSAPYSHKSRSHAENTTVGNLIGTLNVLHVMHDVCPEAHLIQIGSMGEYDPSTKLDIPEGVFDLKIGKKKAKDVIFPRRPGSWYHASKVASTYYIDCACRWWGLRATDIMQGIVYGGWTPEISELESYTRLDSDEAFGTVPHRFIVQAVIGSPLTIYGKGLHKRGFLAINDSVQCLMLAVENSIEEGEYRTWNQLDTVHSMNNLADAVIQVADEYGVDVEKLYIKSPRAENVSDHYYSPIVKKLKALGFTPTRKLEEEIRFLFGIMLDNTDKLVKLSDVVMPKILWK